jgi:hypothetical protein
MNSKIKIHLLLSLFIFSSCHSQDVKFADLEKISTGFDVSGFYHKRLKKTKEIVSTEPKQLDKKSTLKLLENAFFIKDTLGYYKSEGRFPTALYLESTNDWMTRNKKPTEIFGFGYKTVAYDPEKDTLAILNTVPFPKMDMVEDRKGDLMYLEVGKTSKDIADFNKIKTYLSKNCKEVSGDGNDQNNFHWESEFFYYDLSKTENKEEEIISYDLQGNKKSKWVNVTDIRLFMYTKSFIKKMEELQIYSSGNRFWKKPL